MRRTIFGETVKNKETILFSQIKGIASEVFQKTFAGDSHLFFNNRIVFLGPQDLFRILVELKIKENESVAKDILLRNLYKAEQMCPGSAVILLSKIVEAELKIKKSGLLDRSFVNKIVEDAKIEILQDSILKAIELGGSNCSMSIIKNTRKSYVSCDDCFSFPVIQIKEFGEKLNFSNSYLVVYDGVIERASQIDKIINEHIEKETSVVLLARGFGYEVVSTLLHNWRAQKTKIVPITSTVDLNSEFVIKDLSACLKNENSNLSLEEDFLIKNIKIEDSKLLIQDERLSKSSKELISKILKESTDFRSLKETIGERIKFLSSRRIEVGIGKEFGNTIDVIFDRIDYINRNLIRSRKSGCVEVMVENKTIVVPIEAINIADSLFNSLKNNLSYTFLVKNVA